jgi:poly(A) polymerase
MLAMEIVRRLQTAGFEAYWVGGCVRDRLLGQNPKDFDIATSASPTETEKIFAHTKVVGKQFGVVLVLMAGRQFEIASFRAESDYADGRHPRKVIFCHAQADAQRRDFTVNGLFYDPIAERLFDWVGGEADLRNRRLRAIGSPRDRFSEDHLRLLRTVRFAAELNFEIEDETLTAVRSLAPLVQSVSAERIREELVKLLRPPHASRGLLLLRESGLLPQVLPEVDLLIACDQSPGFHPEGSVFEHVRCLLNCLPQDACLSLVWAALLHDIGKPATLARDPKDQTLHFYGHETVGAEIAERILRRLRFPRRQIETICECVRHHMQFKDAPRMRQSTLRRMLLRATFPLELELHRLDCLGSHGSLEIYDFLTQQAEQLNHHPPWRPPLLNGSDLMALGAKPGPKLGALLAEIREKQLLDELTTIDDAKAWARQRLSHPASGDPEAG